MCGLRRSHDVFEFPSQLQRHSSIFAAYRQVSPAALDLSGLPPDRSEGRVVGGLSFQHFALEPAGPPQGGPAGAYAGVSVRRHGRYKVMLVP